MSGRVESGLGEGYKKYRGLVLESVPHVMSVVQPLLPSGVSFAVVDETGRVLFHTDKTRRLFENLFAESDHDTDLRSAVATRREDFSDLRYHGVAERSFVMPLDEM